MGVPGFFGWLVQHCAAALVSARHPKSKVSDFEKKDGDDETLKLSRTQMDCLYLDLNGIIHPCCHPDKNAPQSEAEMMGRICKKVDEIVDLLEPTKLLMLAIDGTAPRAKMNQQRTRRFRSAQLRVREKEVAKAVREDWKEVNLTAPEESQIWDSNVITPGTQFMDKVAEHLKFYTSTRINTHKNWKNLKVIISGSNEPGEGEHKIIQHIKRQRLAKDYDPNTKHCIVGEDADLIMLAMSIHSPHIYILRGALPPRSPRPNVEYPKYNYLVVEVIVQYFEKVFQPILTNNTLDEDRRDLQKMLDDLTLVFCLVGNDFLPNIPGMKIQYNAIGVSLLAYVDIYPSLDGYLTENGKVVMSRFAVLLDNLASNFRTVAAKDAEAAKLQALSKKPPPAPPSFAEVIQMNKDQKRDAFMHYVKYHMDNEIERDIEQHKKNDAVKIGTAGWEDRHYDLDFEKRPGFTGDLRKDVALEYLKGLCWVVEYYFQGCPSWTWYYPYNYGPILASIVPLAKDASFAFPTDTQPYSPFEQLSAVLPRATAEKVLPSQYLKWLYSKKSPLCEYYPSEFKVDMRQCPPPWHCTVILPFIDDVVYLPILKKLQKKYKGSPQDVERNSRKASQVYTRCEDSGSKLITPFTDGMEEIFPDLEECHVLETEQVWSPVTNNSTVLPGTKKPDYSSRLKPGGKCRKPSFTFQSRIITAGLPLVLQPGRKLDHLQQYWQTERVPCWHFAQFGRCKFGDTCFYTHEKPKEDKSLTQLEKQIEKPVAPEGSGWKEKRPREEEEQPKKQPKIEKMEGKKSALKTYITAGPGASRDSLREYVSQNCKGVTVTKLKWKLPDGRSTGTMIVRTSTAAECDILKNGLCGKSLPGSKFKMSVLLSEGASSPRKVPTPKNSPAIAPVPSSTEKVKKPSSPMNRSLSPKRQNTTILKARIAELESLLAEANAKNKQYEEAAVTPARKRRVSPAVSPVRSPNTAKPTPSPKKRVKKKQLSKSMLAKVEQAVALKKLKRRGRKSL